MQYLCNNYAIIIRTVDFKYWNLPQAHSMRGICFKCVGTSHGIQNPMASGTAWSRNWEVTNTPGRIFSWSLPVGLFAELYSLSRLPFPATLSPQEWKMVVHSSQVHPTAMWRTDWFFQLWCPISGVRLWVALLGSDVHTEPFQSWGCSYQFLRASS